VNVCRSCGRDFASVVLFDRHRVGKHGYTYHEGLAMEQAQEDGRRCLDADEIRALGWERNRAGRGADPIRSADVGNRLRGGSSAATPPRETASQGKIVQRDLQRSPGPPASRRKAAA
jgi:hypothetical protein